MYAEVRDYLTDDSFISYVLGTVPEAASHWEAYFREHPEQAAAAAEAKAVLMAPAHVASGLSEAETQQLKERILHSIRQLPKACQSSLHGNHSQGQ